MLVNTYLDQFKRSVSQLNYNFIVLSQDQVAKTIISGLGSDFTAIRNNVLLRSVWTTTNINKLTTLSRNHISLMPGNHEDNKQ